MKKLLNIFVVILLLVGLGAGAEEPISNSSAENVSKIDMGLQMSAQKEIIIDNYLKAMAVSAQDDPRSENIDPSKKVNPISQCIADNMEETLSEQYDIHMIPFLVEIHTIALSKHEDSETTNKINELYNSSLGTKLLSGTLSQEEDKQLGEQYGVFLQKHTASKTSPGYQTEINKLMIEKGFEERQKNMFTSTVLKLKEKCEQQQTNN